MVQVRLVSSSLMAIQLGCAN